MSQERQEDDWWFSAAVTEQSESFFFFSSGGIERLQSMALTPTKSQKIHIVPLSSSWYIDTK
jgi:hypothetical protein